MSQDLKQTADKMMKKKGGMRGEVFRLYEEVIKEKHGKEGVEKVEGKLKEIGYPVKLSKFKSLGIESEALSVVVILTIKEVLNWTDEDIFYLGWFAPRYSFIMKMLLRHLSSIDQVFENASKYWKKHYDFGELETIKLDKEKGIAVIRIKGYDFHPVICTYWRGYFTSIVELSVPKSEVKVKENSCIYKGDDYHEFEINWNLKQ